MSGHWAILIVTTESDLDLCSHNRVVSSLVPTLVPVLICCGLYLTLCSPILAEQTTMDAFYQSQANSLFCAFMS